MEEEPLYKKTFSGSILDNIKSLGMLDFKINTDNRRFGNWGA